MLDAIILSDIHLGSDNCQAKRVGRLLERIHEGELLTVRLILNGDVFDSIDFRRLKKQHWKVLSQVRKLSDEVETVWVTGNHDGSVEAISHLLGVTVQDDYVLESGSRRLLVLHGHRFDEFIDKHPVLTWLADSFYHMLQWIDRSHYFAKLAKRGSKTFLRNAEKIEEGSLETARRRHCTAVCCGHTHVAAAKTDGPIGYYNSGCWTELPCSYLTVKEGAITLHEFEPEARRTEERTPVLGMAAG